MLRLAVTIFAWLFLGLAVWMTWVDPMAWPAILMAGVIVAGTAFERFHYVGRSRRASPGPWQPTSERFLDEESGRLVTVWFNPATGERRYVEAE